MREPSPHDHEDSESRERRRGAGQGVEPPPPQVPAGVHADARLRKQLVARPRTRRRRSQAPAREKGKHAPARPPVGDGLARGARRCETRQAEGGTSTRVAARGRKGGRARDRDRAMHASQGAQAA